MDEVTPAAEVEPERLVAETGYRVVGPFLAFYEHYGPSLCGPPLSDVVMEGGRRCQYFQCLALEEHQPGRVRLKPLGEAWLAVAGQAAAAEQAAAMVDLVDSLPRQPDQHYPERTLADIRYLVIHHTGAAADVGPATIAAEHVEANGWPGIGYHFVVGADGTIYRTQDLAVASYHARQFNPLAVGIALAGDLTAAAPTPAQLAATAALTAGLLADLGLPPDAVRGHREMVPTPCPGGLFLHGWKVDLDRAIAARLARRVAPAPAGA
jgi:N-acetyl-anhydromuramyl-L-alanine amidase AmpD